MLEFKEFVKIHRLSRNMIITEKLDGTNVAVVISDDGTEIGAQSRNRLLGPGKDDHQGFYAWVQNNKEELLKLGPGHHFGEWWGHGIGPRQYGLKEKRFSLFNVQRWNTESRPKCCHVVPVLYCGPFSTEAIMEVFEELDQNGSYAVPGFVSPEGIVVYHSGSNYLFKKTFEKDEKGKGQ
jgi:hypothetical protein